MMSNGMINFVMYYLPGVDHIGRQLRYYKLFSKVLYIKCIVKTNPKSKLIKRSFKYILKVPHASIDWLASVVSENRV